MDGEPDTHPGLTQQCCTSRCAGWVGAQCGGDGADPAGRPLPAEHPVPERCPSGRGLLTAASGSWRSDLRCRLPRSCPSRMPRSGRHAGYAGVGRSWCGANRFAARRRRRSPGTAFVMPSSMGRRLSSRRIRAPSTGCLPTVIDGEECLNRNVWTRTLSPCWLAVADPGVDELHPATSKGRSHGKDSQPGTRGARSLTHQLLPM